MGLLVVKWWNIFNAHLISYGLNGFVGVDGEQCLDNRLVSMKEFSPFPASNFQRFYLGRVCGRSGNPYCVMRRLLTRLGWIGY